MQRNNVCVVQKLWLSCQSLNRQILTDREQECRSVCWAGADSGCQENCRDFQIPHPQTTHLLHDMLLHSGLCLCCSLVLTLCLDRPHIHQPHPSLLPTLELTTGNLQCHLWHTGRGADSCERRMGWWRGSSKDGKSSCTNAVDVILMAAYLLALLNGTHYCSRVVKELRTHTASLTQA